MRCSPLSYLPTANQSKSVLLGILISVTLFCLETSVHGQANSLKQSPKTPPTYSLKQFKQKVNGQFGTFDNQPLTNYLVLYVGSTKDFHYFETFGDKKPYYRVARRQLPKLKLADGTVIECPKDQVGREYPENTELTQILGPPGTRIKQIEMAEAATHSIELKFSKGKRVTTIEVEAPDVHREETGLQLTEISILHTEFAPRTHPLNRDQANTRKAVIKVATADLKNCRLRLKFTTVPGGIAYDIPRGKAKRP